MNSVTSLWPTLRVVAGSGPVITTPAAVISHREVVKEPLAEASKLEAVCLETTEKLIPIAEPCPIQRRAAASDIPLSFSLKPHLLLIVSFQCASLCSFPMTVLSWFLKNTTFCCCE